MSWTNDILERLSAEPCCGYLARGAVAAEPTALAALALVANERLGPARAAADWLAALQSNTGSVGIRQGEPEPHWPTALALLAWLAVDAADKTATYSAAIDRAVQWCLAVHGEALHGTGANHDTSLVGWAWVSGTHSWVEPTAFHVLALKAAGYGDHPRTREAVRLLLDRQFDSGGANYGNTIVLGRPTRPHVQPTGIALTALVGEPDPLGRTARSCDYLRTNLAGDSGAASLAWGLIGLTLHGRRPPYADHWLTIAAERVFGHTGRPRPGLSPSPHKLALLLLAADPCGRLARFPFSAKATS